MIAEIRFASHRTNFRLLQREMGINAKAENIKGNKMLKSAAQWFWHALAIISGLALIARIVAVFFNDNDSEYGRYVLLIAIGILVSLYVLFIVKGLTVSAIRLKSADRDQLKNFLEDTPRSDKGDDILAISDVLKSRYNAFAVGRGLISVICVVLIAQLVDRLHLRHHLDRGSYVVDEAAEATLFPIFTPLVSLLVAALFSYWVAQLLPHFMAEAKPVTFMRLAFAKFFAHISQALSNYGAGAPSLYLFRLMQGAGGFRGEEHFGVGDSQIYEAMVAYFGFGVQARIIKIECDTKTTKVMDQSSQEYRHGEHSELHHTVSIPRGLRNPGDNDNQIQHQNWSSEVPNDVTAVALEPRAVKQRLDVMPLTDAEPDFESIILECTALLDMPLPRRDRGTEIGGLTVNYQVSALHTDDNQDEFVIEISKPTHRLEVDIIPCPQLAIRRPEVMLHPLNEVHSIGEQTIIERAKPLVERKKDRWKITIEYPPIGLLMKIELDARPQTDIKPPQWEARL
jgi:hypothetical protein